MVLFACTDGQYFGPNGNIPCSSTLSMLCERTGVPDELPIPFSVVSIRNIFRFVEALPADDRVFAILRECGYEILNACDHLDIASVLNWLLKGLAIQVGQTWTWAIGGKDVAECVLNRNLVIRLFAKYPEHIPRVCILLLENAPYAQEVVEQNAGYFGLDSEQQPQVGDSWVFRARSALENRCYLCLSATESCISAPWYSPFATKVCVEHLHCSSNKVPRMHRLIMDKFVSKATLQDIRGECENPDVYLRGLPWPLMLDSRDLSEISELHARLTMTTAVADFVRERHVDDTPMCSEPAAKQMKVEDKASRLAQVLEEVPDAPVYHSLIQTYIHTGVFAHSEDNLQDFVRNVNVRIRLATVQGELSGRPTPRPEGISWHPRRILVDNLSDAVKRSAALYIATWTKIEEQARAEVGEPDAMLRHARKVELCADLKKLGLNLSEGSKLCERYIAGTLRPPMTSGEVSERMAQMRWLFIYTNYGRRIEREFRWRIHARDDAYDPYLDDGPWIDRQEVYEEVESDLLQEIGGFPKTWPWLA